MRPLLRAPDCGAYVEPCRAGHAVQLARVEYVRKLLDRQGAKIRCC